MLEFARMYMQMVRFYAGPGSTITILYKKYNKYWL